MNDWINAAPGEAYLVKDALFFVFPELKTHSVNITFSDKVNYPFGGYKPLVSYLENLHNARVVICNGAKQGLSASFYALKKTGKTIIGARNPCWHLIPDLASEAGMKLSYDKYDSYLGIYPNNPDGYSLNNVELAKLANKYKESNIPFIHDAAYYSPIYIPDFELSAIGDMQIFSISKSYGLSGLRAGYVVCHNDAYYKFVSNYVEMMTVGVSTLTQEYVHRLLFEVDHDKNRFPQFVEIVRSGLLNARKLLLNVKKDVLDVSENILSDHGMFAWVKKGKSFDADKAKINVVDGSLYGNSDYIRINLALPANQLEEIVNRLNGL